MNPQILAVFETTSPQIFIGSIKRFTFDVTVYTMCICMRIVRTKSNLNSPVKKTIVRARKVFIS